MLVIVVILVLVLIVVVIAWLTWRTFGSFKLEDLTEDRMESDSLNRLTEAQHTLETGVDKLTQELDLMRITTRRRRP